MAGCDDRAGHRRLRASGARWRRPWVASAGATRVATDAGWTGYERQIGTTGVTIDPELYIAFGVSGAAQHVGGLGTPRHIVSVNTDPSCPMTAMADLGLVTDARGLLVELGRRFGVAGVDERPRRWPSRSADRSPVMSDPHQPAGRARREGPRPTPVVRRHRGGGRSGGIGGGTGPGPGRSVGGDGGARSLPRVEERLRRGGLRAGARCHRPHWWEEVPVERWVVRRSTMMMTGTQSLSVDYRRRGLGSRPVQRHDHPAVRLRLVAGRQGDRGRGPPAHLDGGHRAGTGRQRPGGRACAPTGRCRAPGPGGHRLRRCELVPGQGGRAGCPASDASHHTLGRERGAGASRRA